MLLEFIERPESFTGGIDNIEIFPRLVDDSLDILRDNWFVIPHDILNLSKAAIGVHVGVTGGQHFMMDYCKIPSVGHIYE